MVVIISSRLRWNSVLCTVKPLITNTLEEFIKCRLDNFSMSFILYYVNFSICENKLNIHEYAGTVLKSSI